MKRAFIFVTIELLQEFFRKCLVEESETYTGFQTCSN